MTDEGEPQHQSDDTYEMLWDCKHCGSKKLLGLTHRHCPNCGAPQNAEERYFPADDEKVRVTDHVFFGKDIQCRYCQAYNGRQSKHCRECGSPLSEGSEGKVRAEVTHEEGQFRSAASDSAEPAGVSATNEGRPSKKGWLVGGVVLALVAAVLVVLLWKKDQAFEVVGHRWEREIAIERFGPARHSDWCDSLPKQARTLRTYRAVRSHEKVPDGQDCKVTKIDQGDGTMREEKKCTPRFKQKPIEDDKCDYEVNEWGVEKKATSQGQALEPAPSWPALDTGPQCSRVGCRRPGARTEKYTVLLRTKDGQSADCDFDRQRWQTFSRGQRYSAQVGVIGGAVDCSSLARR